MTKQELIKAIESDLDARGNHSPDIEDQITSFMRVVRRTVAAGDHITLRGFGNFGPKVRKGKTSRIITTGQAIRLKDHQIPHFEPSKKFRKMMPGYTDRVLGPVENSFPEKGE